MIMKIKIYVFGAYYSLINALANEINKCGNSPDLDNVVFTEEKNTLVIENAIVKATGGTFNTRIQSMRKFLKSVSKPENLLSKQGGVMLCRKIVTENAAKLKRFKRLRLKTLAPSVYELIAQLKSAKVSPDELLNASYNAEGILKNKLEDLSLLFGEYENAVKNKGLKDQNNYLDSLPQEIENGALDGCNVFIAAYSSFTRQELLTVKAAIKKANSVTAFFVAGENEYLYTGEALKAFTAVAESAGASVEKLYFSEQGESGYILNSVFNPAVFNGEGRQTNDVFAYEFSGIEEEITAVARRIKTSVIKGARYYDSQVYAPESSLPTVKRVFTEYGIPHFIDEKKKLSAHPLARFVKDYLSAYKRKFARREYFAFAKNPINCTDTDFLDGYENFALKYGVDGSTFLRRFKYGQSEDNYESYEEYRSFLSELFIPLKRQATAAEFSTAIKRLLEKTSAKDKVELLNRELAKYRESYEVAYGEQVYDKVLAVLDETENVIGDVLLDIDEYIGILTGGFDADEVSVLPQYQDAVFVGGFKEIGLVKSKFVYLTGLTADVPLAKSDVAMLADTELDKLEKLKVIVEPKIKTVNRRERENAGLALGAYSNGLFISYSKIGSNGKPQAKSEIFDYVFACLKKGKRFSFEKNLKNQLNPTDYLTLNQAQKAFAREVGEYLDGNLDDLTGASACYAAFDTENKNKADEILLSANKEITVRLKNNSDAVLKNKKLSASLLENYFTCPFKNFLDNGLGLTERKTGKAEPLDVGNFLHEVFEKYSPLVDGLQSEEEGDEKVKNIAEEILQREEYAVFTEKPSGKHLAQRLVNEAVAFCRKIYRQFKNSEFKLYGQEVKFGFNEKQFKAITLDCKDKKRYLEGKVDRVDCAGDYIRIIDYKTGKVDSLDKNFFVGKKLQLYLYMNAFIENKKPAGAYYCSVDYSYNKEGDFDVDFSGHTLDDDFVLKATDTTLDLEKQKSDIAGVTIKIDKSSGELLYKATNAITAEDMQKYLKYALRISAKGAEQIANGIILPSPIDGACDYCDYKGMCAFFADASSTERIIKKVEKATITGGADSEE